MWDSLALLRQRNFTLFVAARWVSFLGNAMAPVAIAFAVIGINGSASALGLVLGARVAPQVLLLLAGGVWSDRLPRNQVIAGANLVGGAAQALAAFLLITGAAEVWQLLVLEAVNGAGFAFGGPADVGVVPQIVPGERLQEANTIVRFGSNLASIGGAALAGILVAAINPGWTIAVDAATFFVAVPLVLGIGGIEKVPARAVSSFVGEMRAGWSEFIAHRWLWAIVVQFSVLVAAFFGCFLVLGPIVAEHDMDGARSWALIVGAQSVGLLVGSALMLRLRSSRPILVATLMTFLFALPVILLAIGAPVWTVAAGGFVDGIGAEVFSVYWYTALHEHVAPEALSRVSAYDALGSLALAPLGMAVAGPLADFVGVDATLWLGAVLMVGSTIAVLFVPEVRSLRSRAAMAGSALEASAS